MVDICQKKGISHSHFAIPFFMEMAEIKKLYKMNVCCIRMKNREGQR
jgi:hypothetical protein